MGDSFVRNSILCSNTISTDSLGRTYATIDTSSLTEDLNKRICDIEKVVFKDMMNEDVIFATEADIAKEKKWRCGGSGQRNFKLTTRRVKAWQPHC